MRGARRRGIAILAAATVAGCDALNHYHGDPHQKIIEDASSNFDDFTAETSGLMITLSKNRDARTALESTVSDARLSAVPRGVVTSLSGKMSTAAQSTRPNGVTTGEDA